MKKGRILVVMHYLEIGGAETALIGLLNALDPDMVDVDLFLHDHRGEMMRFVPSWVNVLPAIKQYTVLERPITELVRRGFWGIAAARLLAKVISRRAYAKSNSEVPNASEFHYMASLTTPLLPRINPDVTYDLAISFLSPHQVVLKKVNAKRKVAWIHTDYTRIWIDRAAELKVWGGYDQIVSISPDVTRCFVDVFPSLAPKIVEIENILSPDFVRQRATLDDLQEDELWCRGASNSVRLLSVGRFSEAKNYDNVPDICRRIVNRGIDAKWFIIGYGNEALIRQRIEEAGMQDRVIILGKRSNPYPYIKACDIYVQPSRYEGKSVTVREAQMLCKLVVVTNYPTAASQISNGTDGVIVPMDNEGCAKGIAEFATNVDLQQRIVQYLHCHDYGNEQEVEKIYRMISVM